jgi:predicted PhzF superfamily epimerase YddE/YHI9
MVVVLKAYKVDAFTKDNSGGSPTGVVLNTPELSDEQLQSLLL